MVDVELELNTHSRNQITPVALTCEYTRITALDALLSTSSPPILAPLSQINLANLYRFFRRGKGTNIAFRLGYNAAATITTAPKVQIFGGVTLTKQPEPLKNKSSILELTFSQSANDIVDETTTYRYTVLDLADHVVDSASNDFFQPGVTVAAAGTSLTAAFLEAKLL